MSLGAHKEDCAPTSPVPGWQGPPSRAATTPNKWEEPQRAQTSLRGQLFPFQAAKLPLTASSPRHAGWERQGCTAALSSVFLAAGQWLLHPALLSQIKSSLPYTHGTPARLFSDISPHFKHTAAGDRSRPKIFILTPVSLQASLTPCSPAAACRQRFSRLHRPLRVCATISSEISAGLAALQEIKGLTPSPAS